MIKLFSVTFSVKFGLIPEKLNNFFFSLSIIMYLQILNIVYKAIIVEDMAPCRGDEA